MNLRYLRQPMGLFLVSLAIILLVTIIVINIRFRRRDHEIIQQQQKREQIARQIIQNQNSFSLDDFFLQDSSKPSGTFYPHRDSSRFWTEEETDPYWVPPSEAGLDSLQTRNDKLIFRSLGLVISDGQP